jgi:hypothetical protein
MPPTRKTRKSKTQPNNPNDVCPVCQCFYNRTRYDKFFIEACSKCRMQVWKEIKHQVKTPDPHQSLCGLLGCHCWQEIFPRH